MKKPVSIKSLLSTDETKVAEIVAELEASPNETRAAPWTERLIASTKGGKGA